MRWLDRFIRPLDAHLLTELAETIANDCHWEAWNRIVARTGTMASTPEAESYIRTRIAGVVRDRADQVIQMRTDVPHRALDTIVDTSLRIIATRLARPLLKRQAVWSYRRAS